MKNLFLTSSVNTVAHDLPRHFEGGTQGLKLAFIATASELDNGPKEWEVADRASLVNIGFEVTDYTLTGKDETTLQKDLSPFDVLYLGGGNNYYLLQRAQESGFIKLVHSLVGAQGKAYISTSAGSIVSGPDTLPAYSLDKASQAPNLQGYEGFGLVNFCLLPHWGSSHFRERYLEQRLEKSYLPDQVPLLLLTNNQYVHVTDTGMEIIDITKL